MRSPTSAAPRGSSPAAPRITTTGGSSRARGDLTGAVADFDRALELRPRYPEAYSNRGVVRQAMDDLEGALGRLRGGLADRPGLRRGVQQPGRGPAGRGDSARRVADFDRAIGSGPATPRPTTTAARPGWSWATRPGPWPTSTGRGPGRPPVAAAAPGAEATPGAPGRARRAIAEFDRALPSTRSRPTPTTTGAAPAWPSATSPAPIADFDRALGLDPDSCVAADLPRQRPLPQPGRRSPRPTTRRPSGSTPRRRRASWSASSSTTPAQPRGRAGELPQAPADRPRGHHGLRPPGPDPAAAGSRTRRPSPTSSGCGSWTPSGGPCSTC